MKYLIKYWKTQNEKSISFKLFKSKNGNIKLELHKGHQLEYSSDFRRVLKIMIKPYGGIFNAQKITQENSSCITYAPILVE
jgi:hypothetical protein